MLEEDWRSPLEAGITEEEEDLALLLDTLVSLLLDFGVTLEEDFAELLLDRFSPPSAELRTGSAEDDERTELLEATLDDERTELLDRSSTGAEDDERTLLLDTLVSSSLDCGVTSSILLDDSSSRGAKLLSSSQAESANRDVTERTKSFACKLKIMIVLLSSKYK